MRHTGTRLGVLIVTAAVALAAVSLWGQPSDPRAATPPAKPPKPAAPPPSPADALANKYPQAKFKDVPLEEAVGYFRDLTKLNVVVKWGALEQANVDRGSPVTLLLKDVTAEKLLRLMLDAAEPNGYLDYVLEDNVLTISTKDDLARRTQTRTYDVRDLIDWTDPERAEELLDVIRSAIHPDTWEARSGAIGSVRHLNGTLAVTQTPKAHEALARLLEGLRASQTRPPVTPRARAQQTEVKIRMVESMKQTCLDNAAMALIAVAGLRDEVPRSADEVIQELEGLIDKVNSVGIRNALRLALKDLYKLKGDHEKVLHHLRQMLIENDGVLARQRKDGVPRLLFGGKD